MKKIGITGQSGFIGWHLYNTLNLFKENYKIILFKNDYFSDFEKLENFVRQCDIIVHLAAVNRHNDPFIIYNTNINLTKKLVEALEKTKSRAHVIFSSSTQEEKDNSYGKSKREGRVILAEWAEKASGSFTGLVIPNVFGPFGNPYYNSVVATFSYQLNHNEIPKIEIDAELKLIYVSELVQEILNDINNHSQCIIIPLYEVPSTLSIKVSEILYLMNHFKDQYMKKGIIPKLSNMFEINLFNTFRSYIDLKKFFPIKYIQHTDDRGIFTEIIRTHLGGQVSFSITKAGITRGNHFHTRKIERFAVIKGNALIQLRKIGTDETIKFFLSDREPAFVDMPIWYSHNITNIGKEDLYTIFWTNEFFDPGDTDTFFEAV